MERRSPPSRGASQRGRLAARRDASSGGQASQPARKRRTTLYGRSGANGSVADVFVVLSLRDAAPKEQQDNRFARVDATEGEGSPALRHSLLGNGVRSPATPAEGGGTDDEEGDERLLGEGAALTAPRDGGGGGGGLLARALAPAPVLLKVAPGSLRRSWAGRGVGEGY